MHLGQVSSVILLSRCFQILGTIEYNIQRLIGKLEANLVLNDRGHLHRIVEHRGELSLDAIAQWRYLGDCVVDYDKIRANPLLNFFVIALSSRVGQIAVVALGR